ncbi:hypothetical protein HQ563_06675 [bacterium]|nr:hypothetical protein [bacterium]
MFPGIINAVEYADKEMGSVVGNMVGIKTGEMRRTHSTDRPSHLRR